MEKMTEAGRLEMLRLFKLVAPTDNWKNPIFTAITCEDDDVPKIQDAICFFTGSRGEVNYMRDGRWAFKAPGYYLTIGA